MENKIIRPALRTNMRHREGQRASKSQTAEKKRKKGRGGTGALRQERKENRGEKGKGKKPYNTTKETGKEETEEGLSSNKVTEGQRASGKKKSEEIEGRAE